MQREKRKKLELYYDIMNAIQQETINGDIKPTRVQHLCNMSYDKMAKNLEELKKKEMVKNPSLSITEKGKKFLQDYSKIKDFIREMELEYMLERRNEDDV